MPADPAQKKEVGMFVLREKLASKKCGKPIWFECMTAIGPCGTDDLSKAARFSSEQSAMQSPAYTHALSCYEPEKE